MNDTLMIECGPPDFSGRRMVTARCGRAEHRDRVATHDAFMRRQFVEGVYATFAWPMTPEGFARVEKKVIEAARHVDTCRDGSHASGLQSVRVADVPKVEVAWLWPGRIALGKVTLLAGDP